MCIRDRCSGPYTPLDASRWCFSLCAGGFPGGDRWTDSDGRAGRRDVRRRFFDDGLALGRPENAPENAAERDSGHGCDNYRYSRDQ